MKIEEWLKVKGGILYERKVDFIKDALFDCLLQRADMRNLRRNLNKKIKYLSKVLRGL